ncbi:MAG: hypothetical protein ACM3ZT_08660 [Bacillota bacterium]
MRRFWIGRIIGFAAVAIIAAFLFGFAVMALWNWLMPGLFGLKAIGYWQAWGLLVLSWILFGGLRGHHHGGHHRRWRHRMAERWMHMSPEERERFRQQMHEHWGHRGHHRGEPPAGGNVS